MIIRKFESADMAACFSILKRNYDETAAIWMRSEAYYAMSGMEPQPRFFVAVEQARIVGLIAIAHSFMNHRIYEVYWVNVCSNFRRKGIGSALVRHVLDYAFKAGAESVMLTATDALIEFYFKLGFSHRGKIGHDNFDDNLMEAKPLLGVKG
jgi:ribosomal protein S18 acetylase RimI-like enzyme